MLYLWGKITPACAGNSAHGDIFLFAWQDHPRVCGEQLASKLLMVLFKGSPPRVRGTVSVRAGNSMTVGITPACAGNRGAWVPDEQDIGDHPRVCGEQWVWGVRYG